MFESFIMPTESYHREMITSTTSSLDGHTITAYLGIVSGEAIMGANVFRDFLASVTDIVGGRSGAWESVLKRAKETAMQELIAEAQKLGANAVIGIDLDYESLGANNGMLMVTASGTAVKIS
jgi:uncharacterized protein YbjQ (UPF0145 family)